MSLYVKVRQWFQPYWKPTPPELRKGNEKKDKVEKSYDRVEKVIGKDRIAKLFKFNRDAEVKKADNKRKDANAAINEEHPDTMMRIFQANKPLDTVIESGQKPKLDTIWYYHDSTRHQIYAHLAPGTGFRIDGSERSDEARKKLKPKVRPMKSPGFDEAYDRTHLLPFGYHGSENDPRLVIGWSKDENRGMFAEFEKQAKRLKSHILWLTDVRKLPYGAAWRYVIVDAKTGKVLMKYISKMGTPEKPVEFDWSDV